MKRYIFIALLSLVAATGLQAQVLIKHGADKERVEFDTDKLVKMVFDSYDAESNGDNILFIRESGDTLTFDIDKIYALGFAEDFSEVEQIEQSGKVVILYDAAAANIYIVNAKDETGSICIFNADGRLVKSGVGVMLSVADLVDGLYIVSYNKELNAKIMKK